MAQKPCVMPHLHACSRFVRSPSSMSHHRACSGKLVEYGAMDPLLTNAADDSQTGNSFGEIERKRGPEKAPALHGQGRAHTAGRALVRR